MTDQELDDDLRSLDHVAEERGAAALDTIAAAVQRMRDEGDFDHLMWALPPLARSFALCGKFEEAEALRVAVAQRAADLPADVTIRLSAGIAEAMAPCDALHLFKRADEALFAAKAAGRDAVRDDHPDRRRD